MCRICVAVTLVVVVFALMSPGKEAETGADTPGLILTFESLKPGGANLDFPDARLARMAAVHVAAGSAPSDFTPAGPFRATFEGDVAVRLRTYVKFSAQGAGKLTVSVGGKRALETAGDDLSRVAGDEVRLGKGKNHIVVVYESPQAGDATFRLLWSSKTWAAEPVPPDLFSHAGPSPAIGRSLQVREGKFLWAQLRCFQCHAGKPAANDAMPELAMDAPSLADAGSRLNSDWVARWVTDPRALRPDAHMPRLLKDGAGASDIAAYLASLGNPGGETKAPGDAQNGGRVFANLDCVACHTPPGAKKDASRVPLEQVASKFKPAALRAYLLNPQAHYAWNPMPNFRLSDTEAADLAAYLESTPSPHPAPPATGDAAKGKQLVASVGCLNCHTTGTDQSTLKAPALAAIAKDSVAKGCLAATAAGPAPDFSLTPEQRAAIGAFLGTDRSSLQHRSAPEFAERQIVSMRCIACHARDGSESLLAQGLDAESQALHQKYPNPPVSEKDLLAADQHPPMLTWAGEKLRPQWMSGFIAGRIPYKPRYYLRARMPAFAARAELLAAGLAEEQGYSAAADPLPKSDPQQAEIGRTLSGKTPNQGFSCVQCHAVADQPPFAAFEAPSINFKYVAERLRHDYYIRWVLNPQRIDPNTKMPRFSDDEGKTGLPAFDNDAQKQFEAIWQYLLEGEGMKPPPG